MKQKQSGCKFNSHPTSQDASNCWKSLNYPNFVAVPFSLEIHFFRELFAKDGLDEGLGRPLFLATSQDIKLSRLNFFFQDKWSQYSEKH